MEITQANFYSELENVAKHIANATFLAIDGEFTGLNSGGKILSFDTPEDRYHKLRQGSLDFLLIQFGLATFEYCAEKKSYVSHTYNFYVYPRQAHRSHPDRRFLSQSSSLQFLAEQGFNFNKLIYEGISYLRAEDEERLRHELDEKLSSCGDGVHVRNASNSSNTSVSSAGGYSPAAGGGNTSRSPATPAAAPCEVPVDQQPFINNIDNLLVNFINDRTKETLHLEPCSPFQRKLIYQLVNSKYDDIVGETKVTKVDNKSVGYIALTKADESKRRELAEESRKREYVSLDEQVGFTKLIKLISKSNKVMVGHNMLLDMLHITSQFLSTLPNSYTEFKQLIHSLFPKLIDTKVIASTHPFREHMSQSHLELVYNCMSSEPFHKANIVAGSESSSYSVASAHEAGYDAFMTGSIFISMMNYLGKVRNVQVMPDSNLLEPFMNKLHLMRVQDIPYMNLTDEDIVPDRSHVFHITFPKAWKSSDIHSLFDTYGPVHICWIDEKSAFVSTNHKSNVAIIKQTLISANKLSTVYQVMTYEDYKKPRILQRPASLIIPAKRRTPSSSTPAGAGAGPLSQMMSIGSVGGSPVGGGEEMMLSPAITGTGGTGQPQDDLTGQPTRKKSKAEKTDMAPSAANSKLFNEEIDWD